MDITFEYLVRKYTCAENFKYIGTEKGHYVIESVFNLLTSGFVFFRTDAQNSQYPVSNNENNINSK